MTAEHKRQLEKQLWNIADLLRGKMNADEYKNYILGFIFYKYLSEKQQAYADDLLKTDKVKYSSLISGKNDDMLQVISRRSLDSLGFFLEPIELFEHLVKKGRGEIEGEDSFILEDLKSVLNNIEQTAVGNDSEDDFIGLFEDVDLTSAKLGRTEKDKNEIITDILSHLDEIDFQLKDAKSDVLGDAYEYLIGKFAAGAGKKGGEFYTPAQVSQLLSMIVTQDKKRIKAVYDPTCGSGSLLLRVKDFTKVDNYYGQELNRTTYNLARMNMLLHDVHYANFDIKQGDTLTTDLFEDLQAEALVANPPFSAKWKGSDDPVLAEDERFTQYGALAPKNKADFGFVTHMLYHLADNGTMAVVLPHGVLFRGGAEGKIRQYIIEKQNSLDAVIGLPSNLFYGTSIPATVLVFKKCRHTDDNIFFIDASKEFEKGKNQNNLTDENLQKIFETYTGRKEIEKYSHCATLEEIKENDFNLNIPRYVDTFEEEEQIDIDVVSRELQKLQKDEKKMQENIAEFCDELEINKPF
ncbi:MAG: type I restriction-modification system subunit M [Candidatus Moraniibacteriota bacterium]